MSAQPRSEFRAEVGTVLHVGCGGSNVPEWITARKEVRLDIDPRNEPDIVADMRDLGMIGPFDCLYCCHALEHLSRDDGLKALGEFKRVLSPGGLAVVLVPDLEDIRPTGEVIYQCSVGPVTGLDMYYGLQDLVVAREHMQHKYGYVADTLRETMKRAGFDAVIVERQPGWNLLALGIAP